MQSFASDSASLLWLSPNKNSSTPTRVEKVDSSDAANVDTNSWMSMPAYDENGVDEVSNIPEDSEVDVGDGSLKAIVSLSDSPALFETKDDSSPSSQSSVPVKEIQFDVNRRHSRLNQALQPHSPKGVIAYGLIAWITMLVCVFSLQRAGVTKPDLPNFEDILNTTYMQQHLEELLNASHILPRFEGGWSLFNESIGSSYASQARLRPGYQLAQKGAKANYPVVIIPGFVTTGLELWEGRECAKKHFRGRMWGGVNSARRLFMERDCWIEHLALDPLTGGDPETIRLRAAQGFEAADYFAANYWVWGKLIENLADVGYDGSTMSVASYDWRLSFQKLEERDGYFTKLKHNIEAMKESTGKKVVLAAHSMGSNVMIYFFSWVTTPKEKGGGGGGRDWVDRHVRTFVNIAGPLNGVPKATPALLSGEMRDTTVLLGAFGSVLEQFFGRRLRKNLWITWGSLWAMLPSGGDALWGVGADMHGDDESSTETALTALVSFSDRSEPPIPQKAQPVEVSADDNHEDGKSLAGLADNLLRQDHISLGKLWLFLTQWGGGFGPVLSSTKYFSFDRSEKSSPRTWHDASRTPLPNAPSMKVYCLYGVGIETERAYYYRRNCDDLVSESNEKSKTCSGSHSDPPFVIDTSIQDPERKVQRGIRFADGDGSVPLLSLGYLCADAWKRDDSGLNPSRSEVITREYPHRPEFLVDDPMRSGPYSADHVDVLGNLDMTEDFLRLVTDFGADELDTHIVSDILDIAQRINSHPNGGLYARNEKAKPNPLQLISKFLSAGVM